VTLHSRPQRLPRHPPPSPPTFVATSLAIPVPRPLIGRFATINSQCPYTTNVKGTKRPNNGASRKRATDDCEHYRQLADEGSTDASSFDFECDIASDVLTSSTIIQSYNGPITTHFGDDPINLLSLWLLVSYSSTNSDVALPHYPPLPFCCNPPASCYIFISLRVTRLTHRPC
jgi:hypothetical protein